MNLLELIFIYEIKVLKNGKLKVAYSEYRYIGERGVYIGSKTVILNPAKENDRRVYKTLTGKDLE